MNMDIIQGEIATMRRYFGNSNTYGTDLTVDYDKLIAHTGKFIVRRFKKNKTILSSVPDDSDEVEVVASPNSLYRLPTTTCAHLVTGLHYEYDLNSPYWVRTPRDIIYYDGGINQRGLLVR